MIPRNDLITPRLIIEAVANSFQLTPSDLKSRKRDKETALARQVAMYLIRQETNCSLVQIGKELGDRDHSTVIHAYGKIASDIDASPYLRRKILDIQQNISPQDEWDALPQEEKNRRIHEFKRSLRHILEGHGKEVVVAALKSILEDMAESPPAVKEFKHGPEKIRDIQAR